MTHLIEIYQINLLFSILYTVTSLPLKLKFSLILRLKYYDQSTTLEDQLGQQG